MGSVEKKVNVDSDLKQKFEIRMFNPNFISDEKGYRLGMKVEELDKLFRSRQKGKFVQNAKEFQEITKVSDEWLKKWAPYFKFPVFAKQFEKTKNTYKKENPKIIRCDLNLANKEMLMGIPGIGDFYAEKIILLRQDLGAFVDVSQLSEIWGVTVEQVAQWKAFLLISKGTVKKININSASLKDLSAFYYFRKGLARKILIYRSMNGDLRDKNDLQKIKEFPIEKIDIIALYLDF